MVEVSSPTRTDGANFEKLSHTIKLLQEVSVQKAYKFRMLEIASNPSSGESRIGLLRVAYEGGCDLSMRCTAKNLICVKAVFS